MSAAERVLKLLQKYFGDTEHVGKYSRTETISANHTAFRYKLIACNKKFDWPLATPILWNNAEKVSCNFPRAEINLFQMGANESWNNFEINYLLLLLLLLFHT